MSILKVNSIEAATPGSEDYFLARAWVNFNGTGTVAIRSDGNVSSITDVATARYTVNYSTAIADANYYGNGCVNQLGNTADSSCVNIYGTNGAVVNYSTTGTQIYSSWPQVGAREGEYITWAVAR